MYRYIHAPTTGLNAGRPGRDSAELRRGVPVFSGRRCETYLTGASPVMGFERGSRGSHPRMRLSALFSSPSAVATARRRLCALRARPRYVSTMRLSPGSCLALRFHRRTFSARVYV